MSEWVQKKKGKYQAAKNEEATDPWSAKCVNSQFIEVSILVTKDLHVKTHAETGYEAWDLTGLGAKINTEAKIWKSHAIESNNILKGKKFISSNKGAFFSWDWSRNKSETQQQWSFLTNQNL